MSSSLFFSSVVNAVTSDRAVSNVIAVVAVLVLAGLVVVSENGRKPWR
jgi:hypothetical protein